ncbi:MAG: hypothetical protein M3R41_05640 [Pseudomonadota bacterium]|nr:hypothetical protein [Pseudomonadota bacterium]
MSGGVDLIPVTVKAARAWVLDHHRHLPRIQGGLFAVGCGIAGNLSGVAIAGNPPRVWQGTGRIVISRVSTDETPNACSMLYGAICRVAKALGYREAWTYTLIEEPGTSLRAAGFQDMGMTRAEEWNRASRPREATARPDAKRRWMRRLAGTAE